MRSAVTLLALLLSGGCAGQRAVSPKIAHACADLSTRLATLETGFLTRAKTIRDQHLSLQEYDRQMIALLTQRRAEIAATSLTELSVSEEVSGCTGKPLEDLQLRAHEEMSSLQSYLNTFNRALKTDSDTVYIDRP
jgi:hypothetical protein